MVGILFKSIFPSVETSLKSKKKCSDCQKTLPLKLQMSHDVGFQRNRIHVGSVQSVVGSRHSKHFDQLETALSVTDSVFDESQGVCQRSGGGIYLTGGPVTTLGIGFGDAHDNDRDITEVVHGAERFGDEIRDLGGAHRFACR